MGHGPAHLPISVSSSAFARPICAIQAAMIAAALLQRFTLRPALGIGRTVPTILAPGRDRGCLPAPLSQRSAPWPTPAPGPRALNGR